MATAVSVPAIICQVNEKRMSSRDTDGSSIRFQLKLPPDRNAAKVSTAMPMPYTPKLPGPSMRASAICAASCSANRATVVSALHFSARSAEAAMEPAII